jgi:hypothetical protein
MAVLDKPHRSNGVTGYKQKLALLRNDAGIGW